MVRAQAVDFSRDVLSLVCGDVKIKAYPHKTYWEDVGSLKDYYKANMAMARGVSMHRCPCWVQRKHRPINKRTFFQDV
jgi:ADP-glucose pyrophosphorylase